MSISIITHFTNLLCTPFEMPSGVSPGYLRAFTATVKCVSLVFGTKNFSTQLTSSQKIVSKLQSTNESDVQLTGLHKIISFRTAVSSVLSMFEMTVKNTLLMVYELLPQISMSSDITIGSKDTDVISNDANLTGEPIIMRNIEGTEYGHGE